MTVYVVVVAGDTVMEVPVCPPGVQVYVVGVDIVFVTLSVVLLLVQIAGTLAVAVSVDGLIAVRVVV